jgi:hypothetical protein
MTDLGSNFSIIIEPPAEELHAEPIRSYNPDDNDISAINLTNQAVASVLQLLANL